MKSSHKSIHPKDKYAKYPKMAKSSSLKVIGNLGESRCINLGMRKEDHLMMSQQRLSQLVLTYNKQVVLNKQLNSSMSNCQRSQIGWEELKPFEDIVLGEKCTDLVQSLCEIIDINGKMKKEIQKLETRQEIEEKFKKIYCQGKQISEEQQNVQKSIIGESKNYYNEGQQSQKVSGQNEQQSLWKINYSKPMRTTHMRTNSNLRDKMSFGHTLMQVRQLWDKSITNIENQTNKTSQFSTRPSGHQLIVTQTDKPMSMQKLDEFIQDLNKKVVLTRVKVHELTSWEKSSCLEEQSLFCNGVQSCPKLTELRRELEEAKKYIVAYKQKIFVMEKQLSEKDQRIADLNQTIALLGNIQKAHKSTQFQKEFVDFKNLEIDIEKVNCTSDSLLSNLSESDPVFSIPSMSPTMLQMKCIQRMQVERRKKLRQLRKNVTNTKIMVNDINLMAAGIPSPVNQQMINQAINPLKNRFIRKPMSPVMGSLYIIPKTSQLINESLDSCSIIVDNEESTGEIKEVVQELNKQEETVKEKMNLPYFKSLKRTHR